jgi:hypothetical protein
MDKPLIMNAIRRRLRSEGGLEKLMVQDGLTGLTSSTPAMFEQAIVGSADHA